MLCVVNWLALFALLLGVTSRFQNYTDKPGCVFISVHINQSNYETRTRTKLKHAGIAHSDSSSPRDMDQASYPY
jgi:hypothetical protein